MKPLPLDHATVAAGPVAESFALLQAMNGPTFLFCYLVWFGVVFGAVHVLRSRGLDHPLTTLAGLLAFEAVGVARIVDGVAHGQERFAFLLLLMFLGAVVFLVRGDLIKLDKNGGGSCGGASCGGGGGCGGGGCGGGGCGGCGG